MSELILWYTIKWHSEQFLPGTHLSGVLVRGSEIALEIKTNRSAKSLIGSDQYKSSPVARGSICHGYIDLFWGFLIIIYTLSELLLSHTFKVIRRSSSNGNKRFECLCFG